MVKLDRSLIQRAVEEHAEAQRRILNNPVALIHEAGSLVVLEGVETEHQALTALDADIDFVHRDSSSPDRYRRPGWQPT
ncbi:EAL domain-containing protein [Halorhodospira halochloris]|uniref:EAL domain-containing protein n=1 Tax=Halorhodospira halochloris TaxID=1052 RepID=UPI003B75D0CC